MKSDKSCPILVADLATATGDVVFTPEWKALDGATKVEILRYWRAYLENEHLHASHQESAEARAARAAKYG